MTNQEENQELKDIEQTLEEDIQEAEVAEENIEKELKNVSNIEKELVNLKDALARSQADYQNLVRRVDRDRSEMWDFFTSNIIVKILPSIDNLERIINSTPEDMQSNSLFDWVKSVYSSLIKTLEWFQVKPFESIWQEVDANLHDVMSQMPGEEWIIIQEFEKWYKLGEKVIRHAKVIVWSGN